MSIIKQDWWLPTTVALSSTAEHAAKLAIEAMKAHISKINETTKEFELAQDEAVTYQTLDDKHEFYGAFCTGLGEVVVDEDETLDLDLNISMAIIRLAGFHWKLLEAEDGYVLILQQSGSYDIDSTFRTLYMDSSVELQKLLFGDSAYVQKSLMSILEQANEQYIISRSTEQKEHVFSLEFTRK